MLLALVVFLGLSLLTYRSSDPIGEMSGPLSLIYTPNPVVYPPTTVTYNACGGMGALTADILFTYFGWGAFYVVLSLGIVNALLLMRKEIDSASLRLIGWLLPWRPWYCLAAQQERSPGQAVTWALLDRDCYITTLPQPEA